MDAEAPIICGVCGQELGDNEGCRAFVDPVVENTEDPEFSVLLVCKECDAKVEKRLEKFDLQALLVLFADPDDAMVFASGMEVN
jgi:hypothetical protein